MESLFTAPWMAALLGFALGALIVAPLLLSVKLFEVQPGSGYALAGVSIIGGLVVALGVMFLYRSIAPRGFVTFGVAVIVGFFAAIIVGAPLLLRRAQ